MSLLPPEFGMRLGDPLIPPVSLQSIRANQKGQETLLWVSPMPLSHALNICQVKPEWRIDATVEHTTVESFGDHHGWGIAITMTTKTLIMTISLTEPVGTWIAMGHAAQEQIAGSVQGHFQVAWAVWHASAEVHTADAITGVLWMLAGGISWDQAVRRARLEEATS